MAEYSYLVVNLPRGMPRDVARRILTDHAEYGHWELARLRLYADGTRKATLRRPVIRPAAPPRLPPETWQSGRGPLSPGAGASRGDPGRPAWPWP